VVERRFNSQPLLEEKLARMEAAWRQQDAPIVDFLAPGLSEAELNRWEEETQLPLPPELRVWWGWHNGAALQPPGGVPYSRTIGPGWWEFLSLEDATRERAWRLGGNWRPFPADLDDWQGDWAEPWLPMVTADRYCLLVDCSAATPNGHVPVLDSEADDVFTPCAVSVSQLIDLWVFVLEEGYSLWSAEIRNWRQRTLELPHPIRVSGCV
jgi:hypothetical protein